PSSQIKPIQADSVSSRISRISRLTLFQNSAFRLLTVLLSCRPMDNDSSIGYVILAFALAVGGGTLGAVLGTSHRRLCALISVGAGSLLGVTLFVILPETTESLRWWQLLPALGSGYAVFSLISKYIFHVCPACAASHFDEATTHRFSEIASAVMLALAIHC